MLICNHFYSLFCGKDSRRGRIAFEGNLLFTHFHEIDAPKRFETSLAEEVQERDTKA